MINRRIIDSTGTFCLLLCCVLVAPVAADDDRIIFNRDIRPILSNACFACHGPSESNRQAELRFDIGRRAFKKLESGEHAIVPGDLEKSQIYQRLITDDPDEVMPPADAEKQLTKAQIELIKRWIEQGAEWQEHWSFITPTRPVEPETQTSDWSHNAIDRFVLAKLEAEGLAPSRRANKETLIRRVTLDLTGLPPTPKQIDAFLADDSAEAYETVVKRLIQSPRYGEHMARYWLDVARYGDTHGLHLDNERSLWPYRDWVIKAFNTNMPFDQFTVEQLGGDLLPEATLDQRVATGFNRCNVTTSEGGSIKEEYLVRYASDRVETTAMVWLGLSMNCAVCHEHKYDPISQAEFYQLFAFFNSLTEKAMDGNALLPPPVIKVPTPEQTEQLTEFDRQIAQLDRETKAALQAVEYTDPSAGDGPITLEPKEVVWIEDALPAGAKPTFDGVESWPFVSKPDHPVYSGEQSTRQQAEGRRQQFFTDASPGLKIARGDKLFAYVYLDADNPPKEIMLQFNNGQWEHRAFWGADLIDWGKKETGSRLHMGPLPKTGGWTRLEVECEKVGLKPGETINGWAFTQFDGIVYWDKAGVVTLAPQDDRHLESLAVWQALQRAYEQPSLPKPILEIVKTEPSVQTPEQKQQVRNYFLERVYADTRSTFEPLHKKSAEAKKTRDDFHASIPSTMVMQEMETPKQAHLLIRGAYDKPGEKVSRAVPAALSPMPEDAPLNRLGLGRWLVDPAHPLTSRVTVNRFWQQYFGVGLVKTSEDFGSQGEWPSHPELLDWLAVEFIESGWDVKHMQRLIVMSAAYQQASEVTPESYARDKENRWLSRGSRFRMDAEMVRDNSLAVGGLLVHQIGGRSVKPYQPGGIWKVVGYTTSDTANFKQDHGEALYRRSMYTFWKRTAPPPSMMAFDAPSRETCTVRRERTNTPLQALTLMNDTQFVEASRNMAQLMMLEGGQSAKERATYGFRLATARRPDESELNEMVELYQESLAEFQKDQEAAEKLIGVGESKRNESLDASELAAWTMIGNLLLNLDETVTKG